MEQDDWLTMRFMSHVQVFPKSEALQVPRFLNDDFLGLKRIVRSRDHLFNWIGLSVVHISDKAHKICSRIKYSGLITSSGPVFDSVDHSRTTAQLRLILLFIRRLFCRPVVF